jgi:hypothetical protein
MEAEALEDLNAEEVGRPSVREHRTDRSLPRVPQDLSVFLPPSHVGTLFLKALLDELRCVWFAFDEQKKGSILRGFDLLFEIRAHAMRGVFPTRARLPSWLNSTPMPITGGHTQFSRRSDPVWTMNDSTI